MSNKNQITYPFFIVAHGWFASSSYGFVKHSGDRKHTLPINLSAEEKTLSFLIPEDEKALAEIQTKKAENTRRLERELSDYDYYYDYEDDYDHNSYELKRRALSHMQRNYDEQINAVRARAQTKTFTSIKTANGDIYVPLNLQQVSRIFGCAVQKHVIQIKCDTFANVKVSRLANALSTPHKNKAKLG